MTWADSKLWYSVLSIEHVEIDDKIRELFYHIHVVQQVYYQMWLGKEISFPDLPEFHDLHQILRWGKDYSTKIANLVSEMDSPKLNSILPSPWKDKIEKVIGREPEDATVGQSVIQVATHSCYHRAQINSRIRDLGGEPAKIDFITWIWLGKPQPEWDKIMVAEEI